MNRREQLISLGKKLLKDRRVNVIDDSTIHQLMKTVDYTIESGLSDDFFTRMIIREIKQDVYTRDVATVDGIERSVKVDDHNLPRRSPQRNRFYEDDGVTSPSNTAPPAERIFPKKAREEQRISDLTLVGKLGSIQKKLCSRSYKTCLSAVHELSGMRSAAAIKLLALGTRNDFSKVRDQSTSILRKLGALAERVLIDNLDCADIDERNDAACALDEINWHPASSEHLLRYLRVTENMEKLPDLQSHTAIKTIILGLNYHNGYIRSVAAKALISAGAPAIPELTAGYSTSKPVARQLILEILGKISKPATIPWLINGLLDHDGEVRDGAITALTSMGSTSVPHVVNLLDHARCEVRIAAATVLNRVSWYPADAGQYLSYIKAGGNWKNMGSISCSDIAASLIEMINGTDKDLSRVGADVLVHIGNEAIPSLKSAWKNSGWRAREIIIDVLGRINDPTCINALVTCLDPIVSNDEIRRAAERAIMNIGKPAAIVLASYLKEVNGELSLSIIRILGDIGSPVVVHALVDLLVTTDDFRIKSYIARALMLINDPTGLETMFKRVIDIGDGDLALFIVNMDAKRSFPERIREMASVARQSASLPLDKQERLRDLRNTL